MADKGRTSWADETDESEETKPISNAWSRGNPLGIVNPSSDTINKRGEARSYEKDYPEINDKDKGRDVSHGDNRDHENNKHYKDSYKRDDGHFRPRGEYRKDDYSDRPRDSPYHDRHQRDYYNRLPRDNYDRQPRDNYDRQPRDNYDRQPRDNYDRQPRDNYDRQPRDNYDRSRYPRSDRPRERREPAPLPTSPPYKAFIGNLPFEITKDDLVRFFEEKCQIVEVRIQTSKEGRAKGFGYVEFQDLESLKIALEKNGESILDRSIRVDVADSKPEEKESFERRGSFSNRPKPNLEQDAKSPEGEKKERPKVELKPRSSPTTTTPENGESSDAYKKSVKPNPFGEAKPRDENAIMKKIEERRNKDATDKVTPETTRLAPPPKKEEKTYPEKREERSHPEKREERSFSDRRPRENRDTRQNKDNRDNRGRRDFGKNERFSHREEKQQHHPPSDKPRREERFKKEEPAKQLQVQNENIFSALGDEE